MKRKKVLLVESHAHSRRALRTVLQSHGYDVIEAATPEEAPRSKGRGYHAAVIDMGLKQPKIRPFAAALEKENPDIRIIFTATSEDLDSWALPGSVLLIKPLQMETLCELL